MGRFSSFGDTIYYVHVGLSISVSNYVFTCIKPKIWMGVVTSLQWPDLICLQILLLPYLPASLYPSIPRYQNSFHHRHIHCHSKLDYCNSLYHNLPKSQITRLQQIQNSLARACQSSQIQSHHSHPPVSTLAKDKWSHWIQAPLTYLQSSHNHPTFISA